MGSNSFHVNFSLIIWQQRLFVLTEKYKDYLSKGQNVGTISKNISYPKSLKNISPWNKDKRSRTVEQPSSSLLMDSTAAVDRISDLTDDLLRHILSFLPIKLAFITTVLSKRWAPLCYSLKVLCFNYETEDYSDFPGFCHFMDTLMLSSRVANQSIKTQPQFMNVFCLTSDHVLLHTFKASNMVFDLQNISCGMRVFYKTWPSMLLLCPF